MPGRHCWRAQVVLSCRRVDAARVFAHHELSVPTEFQRQRTTDKDQQLEHDLSWLAWAQDQLRRVLARVIANHSRCMRPLAQPVRRVRDIARLRVRL